MNIRAVFLIVLALFMILSAVPAAASEQNNVQTTWSLLDYIAVDYASAVKDGSVINEIEFAEMQEFSATVGARIAEMPDFPERAEILKNAQSLRDAISSKESVDLVSHEARRLAAELISVFPISLSPNNVPNIYEGASLYAQQCASCHGKSGGGDGDAAAGLDPPPIAFTETARARERSLFALYQVIGQGLEGTSMSAYPDLSDQDRWSLAFYIGSMAFADAEQGKKVWENETTIRAYVPNMKALSTMTPAELGNMIGVNQAEALTAYLRENPGEITKNQKGSLILVREQLQESLAAYEVGNVREARQLALSAYLDGFEPLEAVLDTRDSNLLREIEFSMAELRSSISQGVSVKTVKQKISKLDVLFYRAEITLRRDNATAMTSFLGSFTILLREGLEALLIVVAMMAFLRKSKRSEATRFIHAGWVAALVAGAATWATATYFIDFSGASREVTEGFGALLAAVILLSVGFWMHGKSRAGAWQHYIQKSMGQSLSRGSAWVLFGLAFLVVYREAFETIIFYTALWSQGNGGSIIIGAIAALVVLGVIAWVMLYYSRTLPIPKFFAFSSILISILAIVLAGKGTASLQEAGLLNITPIANMPHISVLGTYPALEPLAAQLTTLSLIVFGLWLSKFRHSKAMIKSRRTSYRNELR